MHEIGDSKKLGRKNGEVVSAMSSQTFAVRVMHAVNSLIFEDHGQEIIDNRLDKSSNQRPDDDVDIPRLPTSPSQSSQCSCTTFQISPSSNTRPSSRYRCGPTSRVRHLNIRQIDSDLYYSMQRPEFNLATPKACQWRPVECAFMWYVFTLGFNHGRTYDRR